MSQEELWRVADELRGKRGPMDLVTLLETARSKGLQLKTQDINNFLRRMPRSGGEFFIPDQVIEFTSAVLSETTVRSILDPFAGLGLYIIPLAETFPEAECIAIERAKPAEDIGRLIDFKKRVRWVNGEPLSMIDDVGETFDAIASCPPVFGGTTRIKVSQGGEAIELNDQPSSLGVLKACLKLSDGGVGFFVLPDSFFFQSRANGVRRNLARLGLTIRACFSIPPGAFLPMTALSLNLVVIKKGAQETIFVAELTDDPSRNMMLWQNLNAGKQGKRLALGKFIDFQEFHTYRQCEADDRLERLARKTGLSPTLLKDVALKVNLSKTGETPGFIEHPNSVYLPLIGRSKAVSRLSDLTLKPHNYVQMVLDNDRADAQYVAGFYNTPLGLAIREQSSTGATIPKISKSALLSSRVFLPSRNVQLTTLEAATKIGNLVNELEELERRLWAQPAQITRIVKSLTAVNREDRFSDWLDTLPFPLASILWTYHASGTDDKRRYELLIKFFEAVAEFIAIVLLSGLASQEVLFREACVQLKTVFDDHALSFQASSFGTWKTVVEHLSKRYREWINGKTEQQELCRRLVCTTNREVLDMISSKELVGVLQDTNAIRNEWQGHDGIVGNRLARERHVALSAHLSRLRSIFGTVWEDYQLLRPMSCQVRGGEFHNQSQLIMGTRTPFEVVHHNTTIPLETRALFLQTPGDPTALQILPLLRIMASPETEQHACYFYNKTKAGKIRFLSYHFEAEAEILDDFPETANTLDLISQAGASSEE